MANRDLQAPFPWQQDNWDLLVDQWRKKKLSHAYLICGDSGLGKVEFVAAFARFLFCQSPQDNIACGHCAMCLVGGAEAINEAQHPDLLVLEAEQDKKVISIDKVRALIEFANKTSYSSGIKVIVVRQAEMLNSSAANALLKTLEEPTENTFLFLTSDTPGRLMPTLRSRCQRLAFVRPAESVVREWLLQLYENKEQSGEITKAIVASGLRPLVAKSMLENGTAQLGEDIVATLQQLMSGQLSPLQCVQQWKDKDQIMLLGYLAESSTIVIKYLLTNDRQYISNDAVAQLIAKMQASEQAGPVLHKRLIAFQREVEQSGRLLASVSNPNPQLIMEGLCWRWSKLLLN